MDAHKNFAVTAVAIAPSPAASGTSLTVTDASVFPATPFNVTICPSDAIPTQANAEIARCTGIAGNVLTITRAQEGTAARTVQIGDLIAATITAKVITDIEDAIPSTAGLLSAIKVSAGTLSSHVSAVTFANSNGVSFGFDGATLTATVATNYQSQGAYLTTAALSQDSSKYAGTNGAITGGSLTVNTSGVSINLPAYLTTAQPVGAYLTTARASNDAVGLNTALTANGVSWTVNSSGLSLNVPAFLTTAALSNHSHGNPTLALTNLSGTTASNSAGLTLSLSAAAPGGGGDGYNIIGVNGAGTSLSATLQLSNSNNVSFGLNGSTITASASQSVQTQNLHNVTLSGNTAGVMAQVSSGTLTLAGGNNITISQNGNAITISGANLGGAQTGISGFSAGTTQATSGTVSFADSNGVSFGMNGQTLTATVKTDYLTSQSNQAFSAAGGSSAFQTLTFGNSFGVSFSNSGGSVVGSIATTYAGTGFTSAGANVGISGTQNTAGLSLSVTVPAQSNQSAIKGFGVSNTGNTAGNTGLSTGIDWVLAGSGSLTLSQSTSVGGPNTVWMQHPAWLTTAMASNRGSDFVQAAAAFAGTNASGTIASNGISISVGNYLTTQSGQAFSASGGSSAFQTLSFTNSNGFTFSNTNGSIVGSYTVPSTAGLISAINLSAGTTSNNLTAVTFSNSNGVSFGLNGSVITATVATNYQPAGAYLTTARASTDAIGLNTAQSNVTWTVNSAGLSLDARGYAGTGTGATNASVTVNSGGVSVSVGAQSNQTIGGYATGNTGGQSSSSTFDARSLSFSGVGAVSVGMSGGMVMISGGTAAAAPVGVSAGTTSGSLSQIVFSNSNGISFGLNGSTVTGSANTLAVTTVGTATSVYAVASANSIGTITRWAAEDHRHAGIGALGISTGNTAGTSGTVQGTYWLQGSNNVSVSQITSNNGSHTLVIAAGVTESLYWRPNDNITTVGAPINASASLIYCPLDHALSATRFDLLGSVNVATAANNSSAGLLYSLTAAIYTLNNGTLSSVSSGVTNSQMTWSSNATGSVTGGFFFSVPLNVNMGADKYWVGVQLSTRGTGLTGAATTSLANTISIMGVGSAIFGAFSAREIGANTANSAGWIYGMGMYSGTTNFSTVGLSNLTQQGTNAQRANVGLRMLGV